MSQGVVGRPCSGLFGLLLLCLLSLSAHANPNKVSITIQDISVREVMEMLAVQRRLNIFVADGIDSRVSVNLYDMSVEDAIQAIADSAGLAVERRNGNYFIVERNDVGKYNASGLTEVKAFKVQYTETSQVETILKEHISSLGKITTLTDRSMLVIEDMPDFMRRIEVLLEQIDREPKQILIEAKILEVTLTDGESFGIDWAKLFDTSDGSGAFGVQGLSNPGSPGLFFDFVGPNIQIALDLLRDRGRLRTLSTPKLLAMEDREARTQVGTRLGYRVTTTINQVTTESIEFLETGIILKVTPSVDRQGMILLDIHPEVSTGLVSADGIPNKSTTQLSTRMLVPDGRTIFLGGLIQRSTDESREGVPVLGDIPGVGVLFSNRSQKLTTTEIVVLITPKVMDFRDNVLNAAQVEGATRVEEKLTRAEKDVKQQMDQVMGDGASAPGRLLSPGRGDAEEPLESYRDLTSGM